MKKHHYHSPSIMDNRWRLATLGSLYSLTLTTAFLAPSLSANINSLESHAQNERERAGDTTELITFSKNDLSNLCDPINPLTPCPTNNEVSNHFTQSFLPGLLSGSGISPWLIIGGAGAGLAAAASGGGGGGGGNDSGSSSPSDTSKLFNDDAPSTDPAHYATAEYSNRSDLETINAKEAYANIATYITGESDSQAVQATGASQGGEGITVAILDTGVDSNHASLRNNIDDNCGNSSSCRTHLSTSDPDGHGTHVAGIAAGGRTGENTSMHGVAYNATILAGCAYIGGGCYSRAVGDGELMLWAASHGAMVANMSYAYTESYRTKVVTDVTGGVKDYSNASLKNYLFGSYSSTPGSSYQQAKQALEKGLVTVLAAGNHQSWFSPPEVAEPSVMAMAPLIYANTDIEDDLAYQWVAVVNTDNNGNLSSTSHACGDAAEFCMAAPGSSIFSTTPGDNYQTMSGTSMAAPQVSGAIALVAGAFPSLRLPDNNQYASFCNSNSSNYNQKQCHSKAVVNRIFVTATDIGAEGIDPVYGHGLLNLDGATSLIGQAQLQTQSGNLYTLSEGSLTTSQAAGASIASQLSSVRFLAVDSYDNAGFIYSGDSLLGSDNQNDYRIDTQTYLNRSMKMDSLSSTMITPSFTLHYSQTTSETDLLSGSYQLDYVLNDTSRMAISYGFSDRKDFSVGHYQHLKLDDISVSQAFSNPFSHFNEKAHSLGFNQHIADGYSVSASLQQGEVSDSFSNQSDRLQTTSVTMALNGTLSPRLKGSLIVGSLNEEESLLGSHGSGLWELDDGSQSFVAGINLSYQLTPQINALFSYYKLTTDTEHKEDFARYSDSILSDSFSTGLITTNDSQWQYGFFVTQPIRINSGQATLSLPTGYSGQSLTYNDVDLDLSADGRHMEYEFAVGWESESLPLRSKFNLIRVEDYGNIVGNDDTIGLVSFSINY